MARYDMSETEWRYIQPALPTKVRGKSTPHITSNQRGHWRWLCQTKVILP
ncbi:MAG: hypothetical protein JKY25_08880 [Robiginitomaculum sp.]|nr:hypothetical protein [Robiginitomaculum sp.]